MIFRTVYSLLLSCATRQHNKFLTGPQQILFLLDSVRYEHTFRQKRIWWLNVKIHLLVWFGIAYMVKL